MLSLVDMTIFMIFSTRYTVQSVVEYDSKDRYHALGSLIQWCKTCFHKKGDWYTVVWSVKYAHEQMLPLLTIIPSAVRLGHEYPW